MAGERTMLGEGKLETPPSEMEGKGHGDQRQRRLG
jgi:hypothetical protein